MGRLIKRYDNRKLYDTEARAYVSLEELGALIRNGEDVQVVDKSSGTDITAQTLTQVILEDGKRGRNALSTEMLHDVIRWSNKVVDDGIHQIRDRFDHIVPESLTRWFGAARAAEVAQLRERINTLEQLINRLTEAGLTPDDASDGDKKETR